MIRETVTPKVLLLRGRRVYQHDGNVDLPEIADVLIVDGRIAAVRADIADDIARQTTVPELGARRVGRGHGGRR